MFERGCSASARSVLHRSIDRAATFAPATLAATATSTTLAPANLAATAVATTFAL